MVFSISLSVGLLAGCSSGSVNDTDTRDSEMAADSDTTNINTKTPPDIYQITELERLLASSDKVVGYNFNGRNGNPASVGCYDLYTMNTKEICATARNKVILTSKQRDDLINISSDTSTYSGNWSGLAGVCFIPHHGFAFFRSDSLIAQVNICFLCAGIRTRPYYKSDELTQTGIEKYKNLIKEIGLEMLSPSEYTH